MAVFDCQGLGYRIAGKILLKPITWQLEADQCVAIVGESGAGKSTFLQCLNGLIRPTSGKLHFEGKSIPYDDAKALRAYRKSIGMVFQTPCLLESQTLFDNVALPLHLADTPPEDLEKRVNDALKQVGLSNHATKSSKRLSGGQRQRAAIAMALVTQPKVLLCDEPTSALDATTAREILALIEKLHKQHNIPVVLISHDLATVQQIATDIAILHQGEMVERGPIDQILMKPKAVQTQQWLEGYFTPTLSPSLNAHLAKTPITLLHLRFYQNMTFQPILAKTMAKFGVSFTILQARIETFHTTVIGTMIVGLEAPCPKLKSLLKHLEKHDVITTVYKEASHGTGNG